MFKLANVSGDNVFMTGTEGGDEDKGFVFSIKDYTTNGLLVYQYNDGKKGDSATFDVERMAMGAPGGQIYEIDPIESEDDDDFDMFSDMKKPEEEKEAESDGVDVSPMFDDMKKEPDEEIESDNAKQEVDAMNKNILGAKNNDNLHFTINVAEDAEVGAEKDNNIVLEITDINEKYIECFMSDINGPISAYLASILDNKNLAISKDNLIKVENGKLVLDVMDIKSKKTITIPSINWVGLNKYEHPTEDGGGQNTLSQKELNDIMMKMPNIANYWLKEPGAVETLFGASPSGRYTASQQMKKMNLDSSYLTKGKHIQFKILNNKKLGSGFEKTLDPAKEGGYSGIMLDSKTIITHGKINNRHWIITLKNKLKGHRYDVTYQYCSNRNECYNRGPGAIEITDIN